MGFRYTAVLCLQALRGAYAFVPSSAPRNGVDKTIPMTEP